MKPIGRSPSYLIRNPYSYCLRMVIPKDLRRILGKKELRHSLKTGYVGEAKEKARYLAGQIQVARDLNMSNAMVISSDDIFFDIRAKLKCRWGCEDFFNQEEMQNRSGFVH